MENVVKCKIIVNHNLVKFSVEGHEFEPCLIR